MFLLSGYTKLGYDTLEIRCGDKSADAGESAAEEVWCISHLDRATADHVLLLEALPDHRVMPQSSQQRFGIRPGVKIMQAPCLPRV